jgi:hypothetical protein
MHGTRYQWATGSLPVEATPDLGEVTSDEVSALCLWFRVLCIILYENDIDHPLTTVGICRLACIITQALA